MKQSLSVALLALLLAFAPAVFTAAAAPAQPAPAPPAAPEAPRKGISAHIEVDTNDSAGGEEETHVTGTLNISGVGDVTVEAGEVYGNDLVSMGGDVVILGEVRGDVVVFNGSLEIDGRVKGNAVAILTDTTLGDNARIAGDMVHIGGSYDASPEAKIGGESVHTDFDGIDLAEGAREVASNTFAIMYIFRLILLAVLFWGMLIAVLVAPAKVTQAGEALGQNWVRAILLGLGAYAAYVVLAVLFALLCLILIGIPLLAVLMIAWFVLQVLGLASLLWVLGDRLGRNVLRREVSPAVAFLIGFLVYLPTQIIPFHLGFLWLSLGLLGYALHSCLVIFGAGLALSTHMTAFDGLRSRKASPAEDGQPPAPAPPPSTAPPSAGSGLA
jgi:hypothetical protein